MCREAIREKLMALLVLQLLFFMFLMIVNGEPLRFYLLRHLRLFSDLDFVQICILDVYLGGLLLYVIAMLPLMLFNRFIILGLAVLGFGVSVFAHSNALRQVTKPDRIRAFLGDNKAIFYDYLPLFAMFIIVLLVDLTALSGYVFGGIFDESIHALKTQVIVENNYVPLTLQPYLQEGNIYPQASHVIFAFGNYALNIIIPKVVFYVSVLFKALTVFGAYFLGRKLSLAREYYLGLSFVFTFISSWPLFVAWGANPFLVGFPLFLVCLGLLYSLIRSQTKTSYKELVAAGLLLGLAGAIIVTYLQTLMMVVALVSIYWLVTKSKSVRRKLFEFVIIFSVSLLVLSPFLYRFVAFYQYPGHNIGIPEDFSGYQKQGFALTQAVQWAFDNLSPYFELRLLMLFPLVGLCVLVWINRKSNNMKSILAYASAIFLSAVSLSFIAFFLPGDFEIVSWGHQGIIIAISLNLFVLAFFLELARLIKGMKFTWLSRLSSKFSRVNLMLAVVIPALITAPFIYHRIMIDSNSLSGTYRMFAVTTQDDLDLMTWMQANLSSNAVILVSLYEPGLYIPTISHHRIVYPYSASSFSLSYQTLLDSLDNNVVNRTVYDLASNLSISHVYVGSNGAYWWFKQRKWDPGLFLGNPNFQLVKNFGNAYLFKLNYTNPNTVFLDDFEHERWDDYGWQTYFEGNGLGNVTIQNDFENSSQRSLRITSQAVYTVFTWRHATYITRKIYVQNDSDVTLSFRLNATGGFNGQDTFAVLISNIYRNQTLIMTTTNGVYQDYRHSQLLNQSVGTYEFKDSSSISSLWHQDFNTSLPVTLIMELVNYDFDGIENVAYVDNITVTSTPVG